MDFMTLHVNSFGKPFMGINVLWAFDLNPHEDVCCASGVVHSRAQGMIVPEGEAFYGNWRSGGSTGGQSAVNILDSLCVEYDVFYL